MFQRLVLIVGASLSIAVGIYALLTPQTALTIFGFIVETPETQNQIRAQFGGYYIMAGLAMLGSLFGYFREHFGLGTIIIFAGGLFFGRVASLVIEGPEIFLTYPFAIQALYFIEFTLMLSALLALPHARG